MTTDRTTAPRPHRPERPAPHAAAPSPGADAFAELLGAQAPAQPQPRPQPRDGGNGGRRDEGEPQRFETSVGPRDDRAAGTPGQAGQNGVANGQNGAPSGGQNGAAAQGGAVNAGGQGAPGQAGAVGPLGAGPMGQAAGAIAGAVVGAEGQLGAEGEAAEGGQPNAQIKLPKVAAMPVPAPPAGKAATPAGWLGPKAEELKPTPPLAPPPPANPVSAPPNGESATPSGWRGPDTAAPAPQSASTAPVQTAPTTTTSTTSQPQPTSTTPLAHAPTAVTALLQVAHERGISRARINLRPVELGGIEVRLHSTSAGITAHLVADSPEAAKLLSQAGDELRRNLEQRDVNLLSLQVSVSADDRREAQHRPGDDADLFRTSVGPRGDRAEEPEAAPTTTTSTLELPGGLLVDVLA